MRIDYEIDLETGVCSTPCPHGIISPELNRVTCVGGVTCERCQYNQLDVLDEENNEFYVECSHE